MINIIMYIDNFSTTISTIIINNVKLIIQRICNLVIIIESYNIDMWKTVKSSLNKLPNTQKCHSYHLFSLFLIILSMLILISIELWMLMLVITFLVLLMLVFMQIHLKKIYYTKQCITHLYYSLYVSSVILYNNYCHEHF